MTDLQSADCPPVPASQLRPATEDLGLDVTALASHLAGVGITLAPEVAPRRFAGGLANRNFLLRANAQWMVLRCPPEGPLPPGAHDMRREHRILSRLWQALPLAPRSHYLCEDVSVLQVPFQLLAFRAGTAIRGDCLNPLPDTPATGAALSALMVSALTDIHAVSPERIGLDDLGRPQGFFQRTRDGWLQRAARLGAQTLPRDAAVIATWLQDADPPQEDDAVLLHNDFKLDNILIDPESVAALAVVDWDMGTRGPAASDVATMLSYWSEPGDRECMHRLAQMPTARPGFLSREQALQAYRNATGRPLAHFLPYRILAIFRLAIVFLQLHQLFLTNKVRDPRYASFGSLGNELFSVAIDVLDERSL